MWGVFACWGRGGEVGVVGGRQREGGRLVGNEAVASRWLVGCRVHGDGGFTAMEGVERWGGGMVGWRGGKMEEGWRGGGVGNMKDYERGGVEIYFMK